MFTSTAAAARFTTGRRWLRALAALVAGFAVASAHAASIDPGDFILQYDRLSGNISLFFTGTGVSGAGPISLEELNILTLGDGSAGAVMPAGIPSVTPGQGGLNGARATLPAASFQTFNTGINSDGINGVFSQIYNANLGTAWITFTKTNPGVSDTLNLGNVAPTGWSQANVNTIFITDPVLYEEALNPGYFGYTATGSDARIGRVQAVPEPGAFSLLAAGLIGVTGLRAGCRRIRRRGA